MGQASAKPEDRVTAEELAKLKEVFAMFDEDGSGSIDVEEMEKMVAFLWPGMDKGQMLLMIDEMDESGNGQIDLDEFLKAAAKRSDGMEKEIKMAFQLFDKKEKGYLTAEDVRDGFHAVGERLTTRQLLRLMRVAQADEQQRVHYYGFAKVIRGQLAATEARKARDLASSLRF